VDINAPAEWLPQQPPILMLDRATIEEPGRRGTGHKTFIEGDPWFAGHFPGEPILPGIYIIEAIAQTAMLVLMTRDTTEPPTSPEPGYLAKVEKAGFFKPVLPGTAVAFHIEVTRRVNRFVMVTGEAEIGDGVACRCALTLAMAEKNDDG